MSAPDLPFDSPSPLVPDPADDGSSAASTSRLPRWRSESLLAGGREALIEHLDGVYRLRLTASGKLILTK